MKKKLLLIAAALCASFYVNDYVAVQHKHVEFNELHKKVQREIECLALNIYRESGYEPLHGQIAVAFVTLNRLISPSFPKSVCEVVYQKRNGVCQFSWTCMSNLPRMNLKQYEYIKKLSTHVYLNFLNMNDPSLGALFYHADYVSPRWNLEKTTQIGRHIFYKM